MTLFTYPKPCFHSLRSSLLYAGRGGLLWLLLLAMLVGCKEEEEPPVAPGTLQLSAIRVGTRSLVLDVGAETTGAPTDQPVIIAFSSALNTQTVPTAVALAEGATPVEGTFAYLDNDRTVSFQPDSALQENTVYTLVVSEAIKGANGETFQGIAVQFRTEQGALTLESLFISERKVEGSARFVDVPLQPEIILNFSRPLNPAGLTPNLVYLNGPKVGASTLSLTNDNQTLTLTTSAPLDHLNRYQLVVTNQLKGEKGEAFAGFSRTFYTTKAAEPQFPLLSDDALLTLVQEKTFGYFWEFAHPASGMARERNTSGNTVTSGGSGFGLMALIVGIERGFITRQEGLDRFDQILTFLEGTDRFHGAWSHWIDGNSGRVQPFSTNDNGGDLVETAFLVQGLLTVRQYLDAADATEQALIDRINTLWQGVEWDWYTRGGQDVLYWHWSPDKEWAMNMPIAGYNEALIVYVLAAASPTHTIEKSVYTNGWARNGGIVNGKSFYDITLPVGYDYGGPLFFAHYSFLGLDPRNLSDPYADYWTQNVNHSRINHAYGVDNPQNFVSYSDSCWGLTASDNHQGYSAHSPTNDLGVITPTAALSSFPYTPDESMKAMKFFYYEVGDKLWGDYGFYDAFNVTEGWYGNSYLAIDQGPIPVMIENHRTGLLWDLFMSAPEVKNGLDKLGFSY